MSDTVEATKTKASELMGASQEKGQEMKQGASEMAGSAGDKATDLKNRAGATYLLLLLFTTASTI